MSLAPDTGIEHLDFEPTLTCDWHPAGRPHCTEPALFALTVHDCENPAGRTSLACAKHLADDTTRLRAYIAGGRTAYCACGHRITRVSDAFWDVRPLDH